MSRGGGAGARAPWPSPRPTEPPGPSPRRKSMDFVRQPHPPQKNPWLFSTTRLPAQKAMAFLRHPRRGAAKPWLFCASRPPAQKNHGFSAPGSSRSGGSMDFLRRSRAVAATPWIFCAGRPPAFARRGAPPHPSRGVERPWHFRAGPLAAPKCHALFAPDASRHRRAISSTPGDPRRAALDEPGRLLRRRERFW